MKRRGLSSVVAIAIMVIIMIVIIALGVMEYISSGYVMKSRTLVRMIVILAGCVITIIRLLPGMREGKSLRYYEYAYRKEISTAFSREEQKKYRKMLLKAIALYNQNNYQSAIKKLQELKCFCSKPKDYSAVLLFLALSQTDAGLISEAVSTYEELLTYDRECSTARSNLGMLYNNHGRYDEAIKCYTAAIELDSSNAYAWSNLAQSYMSAGRWKDVIEPAQKAISIKGDMHQAYTALCVACFAMGDIEQSKLHFERAVMNGANADNLRRYLMLVSESGSGLSDNERIIKITQTLQRDTALPMVEIRLPAPNDGNKSRIGGAPVDSNVPLDSKGAPMRLLAAIWCSEIRGVPDFPDRGVLRFYVADDEVCGADFKNPNIQSGFRVMYDPDEGAFDGSLRDDPNISADFPVQKCLPLRLSPAMGYMLSSNYNFEDALNDAMKKLDFDTISDEEHSEIYYRLEYGGHRIGGYPCFEQCDPRDAEPALRVYDTLLLQIVSHTFTDDNGKDTDLIMFGDEGSCQFFIPREKLRQRDFSDVMFWWDCN